MAVDDDPVFAREVEDPITALDFLDAGICFVYRPMIENQFISGRPADSETIALDRDFVHALVAALDQESCGGYLPNSVERLSNMEGEQRQHHRSDDDMRDKPDFSSKWRKLKASSLRNDTTASVTLSSRLRSCASSRDLRSA